MGENNESIERKEDQQDERKHEPLTALIGGEPAPMLPVGVGPDGRVGLIHPENGAPPENKAAESANQILVSIGGKPMTKPLPISVEWRKAQEQARKDREKTEQASNETSD